jgi:hypothetical protein
MWWQKEKQRSEPDARCNALPNRGRMMERAVGVLRKGTRKRACVEMTNSCSWSSRGAATEREQEKEGTLSGSTTVRSWQMQRGPGEVVRVQGGASPRESERDEGGSAERPGSSQPALCETVAGSAPGIEEGGGWGAEVR